MQYRLFLATIASAALAAAPIAAQANTRAESANVPLSGVAGAAQAVMTAADMGQDDCDNDGRLDDLHDEDQCGKGIKWLVFGGVGIAIIALIFAAGGSGDSPARSPGT